MDKSDEMCITKEEYVTMLTDIQSIKQCIEKEVMPDLKRMDTRDAEMHHMITGNGEPQKGLAFRVSNLEKEIAQLKLEKKETKQKAWNLVSPILTKIIEWSTIGFIIWLVGQYL
jgi:hypothetical protein